MTDVIAPYVGSLGLFPLHLLWSLPSLEYTLDLLSFVLFQPDERSLKAFADTGLPLVLVLLPYFPQFVDVLETIFLGI